jgi:hypothetical protein
MLNKIPKAESLKDTVARSSVYWDKVLTPALRNGQTLLVVGHENNLRSLIMRLEGIAEADIIHLNLPRAVPLAYRLDLKENSSSSSSRSGSGSDDDDDHTFGSSMLQPLDRPDGKLDEATGFLRGEWLGGDKAVAEILQRDYKQVYDTSITKNLELAGKSRDKWNTWMEFIVGHNPLSSSSSSSLPEKAQTNSAEETSNQGSFVGSAPVPGRTGYL